MHVDAIEPCCGEGGDGFEVAFHVVVVEPAAIAAAEPRGLRRLYVVLTRAVTTLTVVHEQPLPAALVA